MKCRDKSDYEGVWVFTCVRLHEGAGCVEDDLMIPISHFHNGHASLQDPSLISLWSFTTTAVSWHKHQAWVHAENLLLWYEPCFSRLLLKITVDLHWETSLLQLGYIKRLGYFRAAELLSDVNTGMMMCVFNTGIDSTSAHMEALHNLQKAGVSAACTPDQGQILYILFLLILTLIFWHPYCHVDSASAHVTQYWLCRFKTLHSSLFPACGWQQLILHCATHTCNIISYTSRFISRVTRTTTCISPISTLCHWLHNISNQTHTYEGISLL